MKYVELIGSALVIPKNRKWAPLALGPRSIVGILKPDDPVLDGESVLSSTTACRNELCVAWQDVSGRTQVGWLAARTATRPAPTKTLRYMPYDPDLALTVWDRLREILGSRGWTMYDWCSTMKSADRQLARQVIRELGGSVPKTAENAVLQKILLQVTQAHVVTHQEQKTMAKGKSTKAAAPAQAEKTEKKEATERAPLGQAAAQQLRANGVKHPAVKKLIAGERVKKTELADLRDFVNQQAAEARDADDDKRAAALTHANRTIRRLQRAA